MKRTLIMRYFSPLLVLLASNPALSDTSWQHYGGDAGGRRFSPHTEITPGNVGDLKLAWTFRTGDSSDGSEFAGTSSFKATPVLLDDTLYISTSFNRVIAIDSSTGKERWSFDPEVDFSSRYSEMFTSRGVSTWAGGEEGADCGSRIIFGTLD